MASYFENPHLALWSPGWAVSRPTVEDDGETEEEERGGLKERGVEEEEEGEEGERDEVRLVQDKQRSS